MRSSVLFFLALMAFSLPGKADQDNISKLDLTVLMAEQGHPQAQYMLGLYYSEGSGVLQDHISAFHWFKKSADQGFRDAQFSVAIAYDLGEGIKQDLAEASQWYEKAALQGEGGAAYNLGIMYEEGEGVEKDRTLALTWLGLAVLLKHPMAGEAFTKLHPLLSEAQQQSAEQQAHRLKAQIPESKLQ